MATAIGIATGAVGVVLSIIGIVLTVRGLKAKKPCWSIRTRNLIRGYSSTINHLEVLFKDEKVDNLSISKIIFWNEGSETISREDIVKTNQLRVTSKQDVIILDESVISLNNTASQPIIQLSVDRKSVSIDFEYLDRGHGFVIQLIHNGISSGDLDITGSIKSVKNIARKHLREQLLILPTPISLDERIKPVIRQRINRILLRIYATAILISLIGFFLISTSSELAYLNIVFGVILIFSLLFGSIGLLIRGRAAPEGLEAFLGDN